MFSCITIYAYNYVVSQESENRHPIMKNLNISTDMNTNIYVYIYRNMNYLGEWSALLFDLSLLVLGRMVRY